MRVLQVGCACGFGGAETVIASLVRGTGKMGVDADVFFYQDGGGKVQFDGMCNVWFVRDRPLAEVVLMGRYDLVHTIAEVVPRVHRNLKQALYGGPVVVTHHGSFGGAMGSEYVTSVSRFGADQIQDRCPKPVQVIYNGIDTDRFHPWDHKSSDKPIVGWVGRATDPQKDAAALAAVASNGTLDGYRLVVVDGSPVDAELEIWLPSGTEVVRQIPWRDMPAFYRSVGASGGFLLSTARVEWCPMNILEAQACGCPVVVPDVGGMPEIVRHQITGFVYDRKQGLEGIRRALDWLRQDGQQERAAAAAADLVDGEFTEDKMCREYLQLYERALRTHPQGTVSRVAQGVLSWPIRSISRLRSARKRHQA